MVKKLDWKNIRSICSYDFEGTIDEVVGKLNAIKTNYPDKTLRIDIRYGYDNDVEFILQEQRLETDEEERVREEREAVDKARWDANDRAKYEELKKKFEGK